MGESNNQQPKTFTATRPNDEIYLMCRLPKKKD